MRDFGRLAQRLFNVPLMIEPAKAEIVCAALMDRIGIARFSRVDGTTLDARDLRQRADDALCEDRPQTRFYELVDGVARIPVEGTLVQKQSGLDPWSGMTGYNQVSRKLREARQDPNVRGILLEIDSPGGEVAGCFTLCKEIYDANGSNGGKPIWALLNEMGCSAAYGIPAVCDRIFMPETGIAGSVGVWTLLVNLVGAFAKDGVEVALRRAGDRKARGGPYEKWDQETLDKIDGWVEQTRSIFANVVAQGRDMKVAAILATEGDWFSGSDAVDVGFVDGIATADEVFNALRLEVAGR